MSLSLWSAASLSGCARDAPSARRSPFLFRDLPCRPNADTTTRTHDIYTKHINTMLQGLRARVTGALNAALGGGDDDGASQQQLLHASDPRLARAERLVARVTSDELDTPDWGAMLELVDMINADPP